MIMSKYMLGEFIPFNERFPEIAIPETKIITVSSDNSKVPAGRYYLVESFCSDDSCDCRKIMLAIISVNNQKKILATIGYGWESIKFYEKWMYGDKKMAKLLIGTYLEPGGIQSKYSQGFLRIINVSLTEEYRKTIIRHYKLWKNIKL